MSHGNALLTPAGRLRLARCVVDDGWPLRRAAERYGVSVTTAQRWSLRYREQGKAGMVDRSSRPHRCPAQLPVRSEHRIMGLRVSRRCGPARIGYRLGLEPSTVSKVLGRANAYFTTCGITVLRVSTDNGAPYRSKLFAQTLGPITHKRTRPYRPQTNGKVERFNRTLGEEWAYARLYLSEAERVAAYPTFIHTYNHHRGHTALGGKSPADRVPNLRGQYT